MTTGRNEVYYWVIIRKLLFKGELTNGEGGLLGGGRVVIFPGRGQIFASFSQYRKRCTPLILLIPVYYIIVIYSNLT